MINNSTNIKKANNHLSLQIIINRLGGGIVRVET
jgi:hypothetical protein